MKPQNTENAAAFSNKKNDVDTNDFKLLFLNSLVLFLWEFLFCATAYSSVQSGVKRAFIKYKILETFKWQVFVIFRI